MINVTASAKAVLHDALAKVGGGDEELAIRLAPVGTEADGQVQLGLVLDRPQDGDQVVEHNGKKVLVVEQAIADRLDGITLDAIDTPEGRRLTIVA